MKDKIEIKNNLGESKLVNKGFAEAFKKAKEHSKSLGNDFGDMNEVPIEEFESKEIETSNNEDTNIKKGWQQWL